MKLIRIALMALLCYSCHRKTTVQKKTTPPAATIAAAGTMLLGLHTKEDLLQSPNKEWFEKNYAAYVIDSATADQLKPFVKNKTFEIFMGTWCGDSRREVPRMFKILEYAGVKPAQIKMILVDNRGDAYKQSPGHEERGKSIHRVPDLLLYEGEKEMNRIVEYPVQSIEKDLLSVVKSEPYQPNYRGAAYLLQLTATSSAKELLKDSMGVAKKLQPMLQKSAELNSLGYVWMATGEMDKALLAFQLNAILFPNESNVYDSLGEINSKLNNKTAAKLYYQKVLALQPGNANATRMLLLLN